MDDGSGTTCRELVAGKTATINKTDKVGWSDTMLPFVLSKKIAYKRDKLLKGSVSIPVTIAVCEIMLVLGVTLVCTDVSGIEKSTVKLGVSLFVFVSSCLTGYVLSSWN